MARFVFFADEKNPNVRDADEHPVCASCRWEPRRRLTTHQPPTRARPCRCHREDAHGDDGVRSKPEDRRTSSMSDAGVRIRGSSGYSGLIEVTSRPGRDGLGGAGGARGVRGGCSCEPARRISSRLGCPGSRPPKRWRSKAIGTRVRQALASCSSSSSPSHPYSDSEVSSSPNLGQDGHPGSMMHALWTRPYRPSYGSNLLLSLSMRLPKRHPTCLPHVFRHARYTQLHEACAEAKRNNYMRKGHNTTIRRVR